MILDIANARKAYENHVNWDDLTDGVKIIIVMQLSQFLKFHDIAFFLGLVEDDVDRFMEMITQKVYEHEAEYERIAHATIRKINLAKAGRIYQATQEWDEFIEREIHGENPYTPILAFIKKQEIEKGIAFILSLRFREEILNYNDHFHICVVPLFKDVQTVIRRLNRYLNVDRTDEFTGFAMNLVEEYREAQGYAKGYRDALPHERDERVYYGARINEEDQTDIFHAFWAGQLEYIRPTQHYDDRSAYTDSTGSHTGSPEPNIPWS
jgi:hypothetical protein